ncbi:MAG: 4Fe-4S binding protein [Actinobacteria bacterium]|nr:4Fe-4S binding protein [Actinomycetota bacterium]
MKKGSTKTLRTVTVFLALVLVAVGYYSHVGIGNVSSVGWGALSLICPVGAIEAMLATKTFIPQVFISLVVIVVLIVLLGKVFCSWICPIPVFQRWFPGRKARMSKESIHSASQGGDDSEKADLAVDTEASHVSSETSCEPSSCGSCTTACGKKTSEFKLDSRHAVLGGALLSTAIFGFPVFCLVCPVGLTFATVLLVMRLFSFGETTWTLFLFPLIIIVEVLFFRKWCSKICPIGAFTSLVSGLNKTFRATVDETKCLRTTQGVECGICHKVCPQNINPQNPSESPVTMNNCTKCRTCADNCPAKAISFPLFPKKPGAQVPQKSGIKGTDTLVEYAE